MVTGGGNGDSSGVGGGGDSDGDDGNGDGNNGRGDDGNDGNDGNDGDGGNGDGSGGDDGGRFSNGGSSPRAAVQEEAGGLMESASGSGVCLVCAAKKAEVRLVCRVVHVPSAYGCLV